MHTPSQSATLDLGGFNQIITSLAGARNVALGNARLAEPVKKTLKSLAGCNGLRIYRSTLIDNKPWQKLTGRVVPPPTAP